MENSNAGLDTRTMTALSLLSAVPLYKISDKYKLGLNTNIRLQQQQTKAADVGNTNLAGKLTKATTKDEESEKQIKELAQTLKENPKVKIQITGHADNRGNDKINHDISQKRANQVKTELIKHGVNKNQITTRAAGAKEPIADNATEAGKAQNRRIEIKVLEE